VGTSVGHPKQDRDPDKPQDRAAHGPCPSRSPETANAGQVQRRRIRMPKPITDQGPMGTGMPTHRARSPRGPGLRRTLAVPGGPVRRPPGRLPPGRPQLPTASTSCRIHARWAETLPPVPSCRSGLRHVVTARRRPRVFLGSGVHGVSLCEFGTATAMAGDQGHATGRCVASCNLSGLQGAAKTGPRLCWGTSRGLQEAVLGYLCMRSKEVIDDEFPEVVPEITRLV
jgi:hypothetical protein